MKIHVEGLGEFEVDVPTKANWSVDSIEQSISDAVCGTMQLVSPKTQAERWHPAVGKGGYGSAFTK